MQCKNTNFAFYQVKNYPNFESIAKSILENDNTIIDVYAHQIQLPNYERINITENELLTFFFNTKSPKMKVRFRRAL